MGHTTYYVNCKTKVKEAIKNPSLLKFWTQTSGKRKKLIDSMSKIDGLIETYQSPKSNIEEKNDAIKNLEDTFKNVLTTAKTCQEFFELRLMFMRIEDALIACGIDPTDFKEAMIEEIQNDNS